MEDEPAPFVIQYEVDGGLVRIPFSTRRRAGRRYFELLRRGGIHRLVLLSADGETLLARKTPGEIADDLTADLERKAKRE